MTMEPTGRVRFWDQQADRVIEIPSGELPPNAVLASIQGIDGVVWFVPDTTLRKGPIQHGPFSEDVRDLLRELQATFAEHYPISVEEWEDGFRRDQHAADEIALWLHSAGVYRSFGSHEEDAERRRDVFRCIVASMNATRDTVFLQLQPKTLTRREAETIVNAFYGTE